MKILKVNNEEFKVFYEVEVDSKEWEKVISNQKQGMIKNIKVDGFRKGKVPFEIAEKYLNYSDLLNKAINKIINPTIDELEKTKEYKENKQTVTSDIEVDIVEANLNKLIIKFIYDKYPTFNKLDYKNIDVSKIKEPKITDKEVNEQIKKILAKYKIVEDKKSGALAKGDIAVFDFTGYKGKEKISGGSGQNYELEIGSNQFIPGFEEKMIGMKIGEKRDLDLKFPKDYHEKKLAGSDVVFKVKLNGIKVSKMPILNEEFFNKPEFNGICKNEKEYKAYIKKQLETNAKEEYDNKIKQAIIEHLLTKCTISHIPQKMLDREFEICYKQFEDNIYKKQGVKLDQIYKVMGDDQKQKTIDYIKEKTKQDIVIGLIFEAIAEKEKISISDKERQEYVIKQFNLSDKDLKEVTKKNEDGISKLDAYIQANETNIDTILLSEKIWKFILDKCLKK